jgi:hypothetical protein
MPRHEYLEEIPLGEFRLRPTEFVLDGFMATGVSVVAGTWGAGKSCNLLALMTSVAHLAPEAWGFRPTLRRHVLFFSEAPEQVRDVLYSIAKADGSKDWQEFKDWFHLCPAKRLPAKILAERLQALVQQRTWTMENGFEVKPVVVLDTTTANIDLENESDNSQVGAAMSAIKEAMPSTPIILVGHTPKALVKADVSDMTFRGAGAWEAEAAATYFLVYDDQTEMRFLAIRKARFAPAYREIDFDTECGSEIVDTPWGEPQAKGYLHGVPSRSSGEARKAAKAEMLVERSEELKQRAQEGREARLLTLVEEWVAEGRAPTKNALADAIGGKRPNAFATIKALVADARLQTYPMTKDQMLTLGLNTRGQRPEVVLPQGLSFEAFFKARKGNQ